MKYSIEFHEASLANMRAFLMQKQDEQRQLQADIDRLFNECGFLAYQISEAKAAKKDSFDDEKFRVKKTRE